MSIGTASFRTANRLLDPSKAPSSPCGVVSARYATTTEATPMIPAAQNGYHRAPTSPGAVPAEGLNAALASNMATGATSTITAALHVGRLAYTAVVGLAGMNAQSGRIFFAW